MASQTPFLFEISSEAGRKIGGIYTVVQSKSRYLAQAFPGRYLLIGFYDERCAHDVRFESPPKALEAIFADLATLGIYCHWGRWLYGHNLPLILIDAKHFAQMPISYEDENQKRHDTRQNHIKFLLWKNFGVDSLMDQSWDFSENAVWGWAVGMLLERLCAIEPFKSHALVAQYHEWIAGSALLYTHLRGLPVSTVFTTHATVLGRSLSTSGVDVLAAAQKGETPIEMSEAYRLKVEAKHMLEMAAAKKAHIFTTVSETVALECRHVLGRYPDIITLNGLDFEHAQEEARLRDLTQYSRGELLQLIESVVAPYYPMRYDNALLTFISGRYEFTNKGFDIYISALGKLNERIKKRGPNDGRTLIGLVCAPSAARGPKISVIKNYLLIDKVGEVLDAAPGPKGEKYPNTAERVAALEGSLKADMETMLSGLIKEGDAPTISLFDLNYGNDEVLRACAAAGLRNGADDAVKVFFYPTYIRPNDGLLNMSYNDIISGMDVGVFPSRYEPFGYTPLEAGLKLNIPVSTDSAGFGRYLQSQVNLEKRGVRILKMGAGTDAAAGQLADFLETLYYGHHSMLESYKEDAYKLMHLFDWKLLVQNYLHAYSAALEKRTGKPMPISLIPPDEEGIEGRDREYGGASGADLAMKRGRSFAAPRAKSEGERAGPAAGGKAKKRASAKK